MRHSGGNSAAIASSVAEVESSTLASGTGVEDSTRVGVGDAVGSGAGVGRGVDVAICVGEVAGVEAETGSGVTAACTVAAPTGKEGLRFAASPPQATAAMAVAKRSIPMRKMKGLLAAFPAMHVASIGLFNRISFVFHSQSEN